MTENRDRRYSKRYQFDDAKVYCVEKSSLGIFKQYSRPFILNDITKGGMSFKTSRKVSTGEKIKLKIHIPGQHNIQVKGKVVWISDLDDQKQRAVGVQFLPFGTIKDYNTFGAREKLERLIGNTKPPESETQ
jgi:Tfp pilus assembly protein PilZ